MCRRHISSIEDGYHIEDISPVPKGTDIIEKPRSNERGFFMAAELGFEPRQTESESAVLPLHNSARNI